MYVYKNIWNGIGKGKYKLSLQVWVVCGYVGQSVGWQINHQYMYIYKNIWNGIGKGKYKLSLQVWYMYIYKNIWNGGFTGVGGYVGKEEISWKILTQKYTDNQWVGR